MHTILIIDDEENIRVLYKKNLEANGYAAIAAGTAEEAKELFLKGGIDLVILDMKLAGQDDGLDILRWLRQTEPALRIIIISGYSGYEQDFTTWLADEYIVKSGNLDQLMNTVDAMFKQNI